MHSARVNKTVVEYHSWQKLRVYVASSKQQANAVRALLLLMVLLLMYAGSVWWICVSFRIHVTCFTQVYTHVFACMYNYMYVRAGISDRLQQ